MAGYLEKRGKRSWRLIVSHGYDSYGNRIKYAKSIKANSRREADKELVKFVYEIENGIVLQNSSMTFKEFTDLWDKNYGEKEFVFGHDLGDGALDQHRFCSSQRRLSFGYY